MTRREFAKKSALFLASMGIPAVGFPSIITRTKKDVSKPSAITSINWGHPLSRGLSVLYPFIESSPWGELVSGLSMSNGPLNGTWTWVSGIEGRGIKFTSTGTTGIQLGATQTTLNSRLGTKNRTLLLIRRKTDTTNRASTTFALHGLAIANSRCLVHLPYSDGKLYFDWGDTGVAPNRLTVSGLSWPATVERWAFRAGDSGMAAWRNGILVGSSATAVTRVEDIGPSSEFYLGGSPFAVNSDLQEYYFFAVIEVEWSNEEVMWWMQEPYAMLMPQSPTIRYFLMPGVPGGQKVRVFVNT